MTECANSDVIVGKLGPLRIGEPWLSRRLRVHQAWYRLAVLGIVEFGSTRPPHERPLGSILPPAAAEAGLNFLCTEAESLFKARHAEGWGVDPVRTKAYMTSSQTLTFNVLAPLAAKPNWLIKTLNTVRTDLPPLVAIEEILIEHSFGLAPKGLGDRTTADAIIVARTTSGPTTIAIETKLGDRFNSRAIDMGRNYSAVANLWKRGRIDARSPSNQLARVHALGALRLTQSSEADASVAELLLLRHPYDTKAAAIAAGYCREVSNSRAVHDLPFDVFFAAMARGATTEPSKQLVEALDIRYSNLALSEVIWEDFLASSFRAGRRRLQSNDERSQNLAL